MSKATATDRQKEIKRLLEGGASVGEIASLHKTTAQAVYSQISRMRSLGLLPKSKRGGGRKARVASRVRHLPDLDPKAPPARGENNGRASLEDHVSAELKSVVGRLEEIEREQKALGSERTTLTDRKARLETANSALTGPSAPAQASQPVAA